MQSNLSNKNESSQELGLPLGNSKAVNPPRKDEFLLVPEESPPLTLKENLQLILSDMEQALPHEPLGKLIVEFLKALPTIAESQNAQPDYSEIFERMADGIDRLAEATIENNRLLKENLENPWAIPPSPPTPGSQGGRKSRTTETDESPGVKQLRQIEKGGSQP